MVDNQVKFESILPASRCLSTFSFFSLDVRRRINERQTCRLSHALCFEVNSLNVVFISCYKKPGWENWLIYAGQCGSGNSA